MLRRSISAMFFAVVFAGVLIGVAPPASACSCAGFPDEEEALEAADVVFVGDLQEVRTPRSGEVWSSADPERFVFAVDRVYKGEARATQSVVTAREGASCGLELAGTGPFLVFAYTEPVLDLEGDEGELFSHLCTGSRAVDVAPVPASFGEGQTPDAGSSPIGSPDAGPPVAAIALAGGLVLLIVLALAYAWKSGWLPRTDPERPLGSSQSS